MASLFICQAQSRHDVVRVFSRHMGHREDVASCLVRPFATAVGPMVDRQSVIDVYRVWTSGGSGERFSHLLFAGQPNFGRRAYRMFAASPVAADKLGGAERSRVFVDRLTCTVFHGHFSGGFRVGAEGVISPFITLQLFRQGIFGVIDLSRYSVGCQTRVSS